jgi:hypothetical protein
MGWVWDLCVMGPCAFSRIRSLTYETDIWLEIAALRAKLVSRLADNFLYSEVDAELLRLREDYAELFVGRDALLQELEHDLSLYLEKFRQGIGQLTLL